MPRNLPSQPGGQPRGFSLISIYGTSVVEMASSCCPVGLGGVCNFAPGEPSRSHLGRSKSRPKSHWGRSKSHPSAAKSNQGIPVRFVKFIDNLLRLNVLRFCSDRDWCPVLIRTGHHQHSVAQCSLKPVFDVRWEVASCDVSEVQRPVGVRPGHANQDVFIAHANPLASCGWPMLLEVHA